MFKGLRNNSIKYNEYHLLKLDYVRIHSFIKNEEKYEK